MKKPRITIVTPTFNQAAFLPQTLASVLGQNYEELEHIIVDALSTDETPEILSAYRPGYECKIIREADHGQSDGINKGMRVATGEIVSWLNSDDVLQPNALHNIARAFENHPGAVAICGVGAQVDREGVLRRNVPYRPFRPQRIKTAFEYIQPATFYRRSAWEQVSGLDVGLHYAMDWELLLRLSKIGECVAIPEVIASYRDYEETKTSTGGWPRMAEIAGIGRKHNGVFDLNYLSFTLRTFLPGVPLYRKVVDNVFWKIGKRQPVMISGWPSQTT